MNAKKLIDSIVEAKGEEASVTVTLTGSPRSVQKALKQLNREKGGKKAVPIGDLAKGAGDVKVKASGAAPKKEGGKDDGDKKPSRFPRRDKPKDDADDGDDKGGEGDDKE